MNVSLTTELDRYVAKKVEGGMYASKSEVVREALRLLRTRDRIRARRLEARGREPSPAAATGRTIGIANLRAQRDEIAHIARKHGACNVRAFGSVVRDEAGVGSDVDLLVDMEPGRSLLDRAGLMLELEELLGCRVDVATESSLRERVRARVLREALPL